MEQEKVKCMKWELPKSLGTPVKRCYVNSRRQMVIVTTQPIVPGAQVAALVGATAVLAGLPTPFNQIIAGVIVGWLVVERVGKTWRILIAAQ